MGRRKPSNFSPYLQSMIKFKLKLLFQGSATKNENITTILAKIGRLLNSKLD